MELHFRNNFVQHTLYEVIRGQVASHLLGSDAFQETDIVGISTPVTKWNHQITKAAEIPEVIAKAFYIAKSGRPGPVLIDITKDAQFEEFDFKYEKCNSIRSYKPVPKIDLDAISEAANLINSAKKPMIVWGQGVITSYSIHYTKLYEKVKVKEILPISNLLIMLRRKMCI